MAQLDHVVGRVGGGSEALAGPGEQGERGLIETLPPTPEDRVEGGTRLGPFPLLTEGEGRFVGVACREPFRGGVAAVELVQVGGGVNPDEADPAEPARGKGVANQGAGGAGDQQGDAELFRRPLHSAGEVDRVAQRAVLQPPEAAGVAHESVAGVDADAQRQGGLGP